MLFRFEVDEKSIKITTLRQGREGCPTHLEQNFATEPVPSPWPEAEVASCASAVAGRSKIGGFQLL